MKFSKYILFFAVAATAGILSAGEIAAERYTKVKNGSWQKIFSTTKNQCYATAVPLNGKLPTVVLDEDIYRELNSNYSNIALADSNNQLLPFVIKRLCKWQQTSSYTALPGKITAFTIDKQRNEAVIDYRISGESKVLIGKLTLQPYGRKKFAKTVTLEFDNQQHVGDLKFFNHHGVVDFARHNFEFAPQRANSVRIRIAPFAEKHAGDTSLVRSGDKENFTETKILTEELTLHQITFYQAEVKIFPAEELTISKDFPVKSSAGNKTQSVWEFDLNKYPVKALRIASTTENYHRSYQLEFKNNIQDGEPVVCNTFSGKLTPQNELKFDNIRADKAILTVENHSDMPLADPVFSWSVPVEGMIIDPAAETDDFKLYYGGDTNQLPEFDFRHYIDKFNGREYYFLSLGNEENNPAARKNDHTLNDFFKKLLPYIIAFAAIATAVISFRMLKKVQITSDSDW